VPLVNHLHVEEIRLTKSDFYEEKGFSAEIYKRISLLFATFVENIHYNLKVPSAGATFHSLA